MQYTETELSKLIEDVASVFTTELAKAEEEYKTSLAKSESASGAVLETLSKAEDKPKEKDKEPESDKAHAEPKGEPAAAKEGADDQQGHSDKSAKPAAGEAKEGSDNKQGHSDEGQAAQAGAKEGADNQQGHDYDAEDLKHLEQMYTSMSEAERKVHHDVIAKMAKCGDMSMSKSETATSIEVQPELTKPEPSKELELLKSEFEAEKTRADKLQKNLDAVSAILTKMVEKKVAPAGKAITSLDVIAKSEGGQEEKTLTKSEIDSALSKQAQNPKLEKSDREAINAYYLSGASINSISHLLK